MTTTPSPASSPAPDASADPINQLAGLAPGSPLAALRDQRAEVSRYATASRLALLEPAVEGGLDRRQRSAIALRVAALTPLPALGAEQRARLQALGADQALLAAIERPEATPSLPADLAALLAFVDRLTLTPNAARPADIAALKAAGCRPGQIVTIAQAIGYFAFEVRLLTGLRLLSAPAVDGPPTPLGPVPGDAPYHPFTLDELGWRPWLETVDDVGPTPEQAALVAEVTPRASARPYYALLAHDGPVLRERTALMKAAMYAPGGLRRAERELGAVAASRYNGCAYCASVHARLFAQLTKDEAAIEGLLSQGLAAPLPPRWRAVVDYAVALTHAPARLTAADLASLRRQGLADLEILDLTHAVAMFAWANRLLQTLGEPEPVAVS